jgi:hypothetical protein
VALKDTAEKIQRTVDAHFADFETALRRSIEVYGQGAPLDRRKQEFFALADAAQRLNDSLASPDRPAWLAPVIAATTKFKGSPDGEVGHQLLQTLIGSRKDIKPIQLVAESDEEFRFDAVFEQLRAKHKITELFDKMAAELTRIIESGDVDSSIALAVLRKMVAALKANRTVGELLKRIPVIQEAVAAYEKTAAQGEEEMDALHQDMQDEVLARIESSVPNIKKLAAIVKQMQALPPSTEGYIEGEFEVKKEQPSLPPTPSG